MAKFNKARVIVGDWVRVRFWDHRSNDEDVREYYVVGRLHAITKRAYIIDSWALVDPDSADRKVEDTCETFCTLKRAIVEVVKLSDNTLVTEAEKIIKSLEKKLKKWEGHSCEPRDAIDLG